MIQPANDYTAFIIKNSSGPFEDHLNIDPDYSYMLLELELDGGIYFLKEQIPYYYDEKELEQFKPGNRYLVNVNRYLFERRSGRNWLIEAELLIKPSSSDGLPDTVELQSEENLLRLTVYKVSSKSSKYGNYVHILKTDGSGVNISGIEKESGILTYFMALPHLVTVGSVHEIDMNQFHVDERPHEISTATGGVQTLMLKWLVRKI